MSRSFRIGWFKVLRADNKRMWFVSDANYNKTGTWAIQSYHHRWRSRCITCSASWFRGRKAAGFWMPCDGIWTLRKEYLKSNFSIRYDQRGKWRYVCLRWCNVAWNFFFEALIHQLFFLAQSNPKTPPSTTPSLSSSLSSSLPPPR